MELSRMVERVGRHRYLVLAVRWSVGSVKKCVQRLLKVLEVSDRTQAAVEAVRRKLVD